MTPTSPAAAPTPGFARIALALLLLWLIGGATRLTILAVPPVLPRIHADLALSATEVGILFGLPQVLFAIAAVPGSLLIARLGVMTSLVIGLLVTIAGSSLRGLAPEVLTLFAATILMGFGIAIMQPALPPLVRKWLPKRIALGTAVYTNGMIIGGTLAASLTSGFVLPMLQDSWRWTLEFWTVPVVVILLIVVVLAPRDRGANAPARSGPSASSRWWPDWQSPVVWRLGLMFGANTSVFFATNAFIPEYLTVTGRSELIGATLTAFNATQIAGSVLLMGIAPYVERRSWPYLIFGGLSVCAVVGLVYADGPWLVATAAALAFTLGITFVLTLALPPLLSPPDDVHRMAAGMFAISYTCGVLVPVLCGMAWDLTGKPATAFIPIGFCAALIVVLAPGRRLFGSRHDTDEP